MGKYKKLDVGSGNYEIPPHIWEDIGTETAAAVQTIPAPFVWVLANIASEHSFLQPSHGVSGSFTWPQCYCEIAFKMKNIISTFVYSLRS